MLSVRNGLSRVFRELKYIDNDIYDYGIVIVICCSSKEKTNKQQALAHANGLVLQAETLWQRRVQLILLL